MQTWRFSPPLTELFGSFKDAWDIDRPNRLFPVELQGSAIHETWVFLFTWLSSCTCVHRVQLHSLAMFGLQEGFSPQRDV